MSEQPISPDPQAPPEIGSRLSQAREAAALTVDQVAAKLLVSASQIRALESGQMPSSYSADYYERTVRKYANFLGLEVDPAVLPAAVAAVGQAHAIDQDKSPAGRLAGFTPHRVGIGGRVDKPTMGGNWDAKPWILGAVILILAVAGFLYRDTLLDPSPPEVAPANAGATSSAPAAPGSSASTDRPSDKAPPGASPAESDKKAASDSGAGASPASTSVAGASVAGASVGSASVAGGTKTADPTPPATAKPGNAGSPEGRVKVSFAAPCWVQTTASDGTRTEKIYQPDQELVLSAQGIASLVIGNAKSARMKIDGVDVNLNQFMKGSSDVARISDVALQELLR